MEKIEKNGKMLLWSFIVVILTLLFSIFFSTIVSSAFPDSLLVNIGGILLAFAGIALIVLQYSIQQYRHYYFFLEEIKRISEEIIEHFNNDELSNELDEIFYNERIKYLNSIATDSFQYDEIRKLQNSINLHKKILNKK